MPAPDPDGQVSLMLCESILHVLLEEGVISKARVLDAINGVVELARESDEIGQRRSTSRSAVQLIEAIDNVEDFRRFVEISTREIVINQLRLF